MGITVHEVIENEDGSADLKMSIDGAELERILQIGFEKILTDQVARIQDTDADKKAK